MLLDEWVAATASTVAKSKNGKAPGLDLVTNEIMKAAGPAFVHAMAHCLRRIAKDGPPYGVERWKDVARKEKPAATFVTLKCKRPPVRLENGPNLCVCI